MIIASDPTIFLLLSEVRFSGEGTRINFLMPSQLKKILSRRKKIQLRGPNMRLAKWVNFSITC